MTADDDSDVSQLAREVVAELDPGTSIGDMVILSRRQVIALAGGSLSLGALSTFGATEASAQSVGSVGTSSERVDVFATSINGGGPVVDGDGIERQLFVIANGASDPAGATAEDLIFEESQ